MSRPLIFALGLLLACEASEPGPQFFEGSYTWGDDADGTLEALFVPDGPGRWKVDFEFEYLGQRQTWTGTAQGDLRAGPLEGHVNSGNPELGYVLRGEIRNGVFEGVHAELVTGIETPSGTVRLARSGGNGPSSDAF